MCVIKRVKNFSNLGNKYASVCVFLFVDAFVCVYFFLLNLLYGPKPEEEEEGETVFYFYRNMRETLKAFCCKNIFLYFNLDLFAAIYLNSALPFSCCFLDLKIFFL